MTLAYFFAWCPKTETQHGQKNMRRWWDCLANILNGQVIPHLQNYKRHIASVAYAGQIALMKKKLHLSLKSQIEKQIQCSTTITIIIIKKKNKENVWFQKISIPSKKGFFIWTLTPCNYHTLPCKFWVMRHPSPLASKKWPSLGWILIFSGTTQLNTIEKEQNWNVPIITAFSFNS